MWWMDKKGKGNAEKEYVQSEKERNTNMDFSNLISARQFSIIYWILKTMKKVSQQNRQ